MSVILLHFYYIALAEIYFCNLCTCSSLFFLYNCILCFRDEYYGGSDSIRGDTYIYFTVLFICVFKIFTEEDSCLKLQ